MRTRMRRRKPTSPDPLDPPWPAHVEGGAWHEEVVGRGCREEVVKHRQEREREGMGGRVRVLVRRGRAGR